MQPITHSKPQGLGGAWLAFFYCYRFYLLYIIDKVAAIQTCAYAHNLRQKAHVEVIPASIFMPVGDAAPSIVFDITDGAPVLELPLSSTFTAGFIP